MTSSVVEVPEARARSVTVNPEALVIDLVDGRTIIAPLMWFPRLWHGTAQERNRFEIFGDGAYIHWSELDEDLTVAGVLAGRRSGESSESLEKWLTSRKEKQRGRAQRSSSKRIQPPRRKSARG